MTSANIQTRKFSILIPYDDSDELEFYAEFEQTHERGARGDYGEPLEPDHYDIELKALCLRDENGQTHYYPHDDKTALLTIKNNTESWEEML